MKRWVILVYGVLVYMVFILTMAYSIAFFGNIVVARTIDAAPTLPLGRGLFVNTVLMILFGLQHSGMARPGFKAWLTKGIPRVAERSTYVLMTCLALGWMFIAWQPMTGVVWQIEGAAALLMQLLFLAGAGLVLWATFMISHTHLFGLAQAWQAFRGQSAAEADELIEPAMYKYSRHPMYLGILMVLWCTPTMSTGHLLMAAVWSVYVFIGIGYEERDLLDKFGDQYADYMRRVPQLLPIGRKA